MTHDLSDFEHQLGLELEAAARRRIQSRGSRRRNRALLTATAAIAVLAVAALVLSSLRTQPAAAHPFRIVHLDDEIHLQIVDLVEDPHAAERQLRDGLGIDVELVARPAPPELVDQVVGAASTGTTAPLVIFDDAGRSERVVLPRRVDGTLTIHYGRAARPDEHYHANITSPACRELWATTPQQAAARLAELADRIRSTPSTPTTARRPTWHPPKSTPTTASSTSCTSPKTRSSSCSPPTSTPSAPTAPTADGPPTPRARRRRQQRQTPP